MLALLLASPFMYIYLGVESSMYLHETFIIPTITSRTHRPVPNAIAVAVAVELPNAMECENAVPESYVRRYKTDSCTHALTQAPAFTRRPLICCFPFAASLIALSKCCWLSQSQDWGRQGQKRLNTN